MTSEDSKIHPIHDDQRGFRRWLLPALLAVVFAVYAPALGNGFALDDRAIAESVLPGSGDPNPNIRTFQPPWHYFQTSYWYPAVRGDGLYRPVTVWSFGWTYQLIGAFLPAAWEGFPQHLFNLLLHVLATFLVLRMMLAVGLRRDWALVPAACFGLHAIHSEAVVGIVGRAELLAFCFGATALLAALRTGLWSGVAASACLFLALCSKESAIAWIGMLPCVLLARSFGSGTGVPASTWVRVLGISAGAVLLWLPLWWMIQIQAVDRPPPYGANDLAYLPTGSRILTAITIWGFGLWKCIFPGTLLSLYGAEVFPAVDSLASGRFLAAAAGLGALLGCGLVWARRRPVLLLATAWFFGFSVLTANVLFPIGTNFGERLYYTPALGICLLPLLALRPGQPPSRLFLGVLGAVLLLHGFWILERNGDWRDDATLTRHDVVLQPRSLSLLRIAADTYLVDPDGLGEARRLLEQACSLNDGDALSWKMLGDLEVRQRRPQAALAAYRKVLASPYLVGTPQVTSLALVGIGDVQRRAGELEAAIQSYEQALRDVPANTAALVGLGRARIQQNRVEEAVAAFRQAVTLRPDDADAWLELATHAPGKLPAAQIRALFDLGARVAALRPGIGLLVGGLGFQGGVDPRRVLPVLATALERIPRAQAHDFNTYAAQLFLAGCHARLGDRQQAVMRLQALAQDPRCPPELRQAAAAQQASLTRPPR